MIPAAVQAQVLPSPLSALANNGTGLAPVLPDAPAPQSSGQNPSETATISGTVADKSGGVVPGTRVTLKALRLDTSAQVLADENGRFTFSNLAPGDYEITLSVPGFEAYTSGPIVLSSRQSVELPAIALAPGTSVSITVRPTEEVAAEQIKVQESQRFLAIFPNYYVSYVQDAAPLTTKQKFSLATHQTLDWTTFLGVTIAAGVEQANNSYAGYGQGAAGYGKRWAAQFANGRSSDYLSTAVFASLFHQDPRYFYQGVGTKKSRLYHALSSAFIARGDNGKPMPNYSYLLGTMTSGALSNAYYPHADRGANLVFENAGLGILGRMGGAVIQEFLGKKITTNARKASQTGSTPQALGVHP